MQLQPKHPIPFDIVRAPRSDTARPALARLVREVYRDAYDAQVEHLHDELLGLLDVSGEAMAVIGATPADAHAHLFVEQYLDRPVEEAAAAVLGRQVARDELAEVGNLAARRPGAGMWAVTTLAHALHAQGRRYAVCAATTPLRKGFQRLGVAPLDLAPADGRRLQDGASRWGRYYETAPRVVLIDVEAVCLAAWRQPGLVRRLSPFWSRIDPRSVSAFELRCSA